MGDRDVDHVVVGPAGVCVVETKYTDSRLNLKTAAGRRTAAGWAHQAQRNARSVRLRLGSAGLHVEVASMLVVWGPEVAGSPEVVDSSVVYRGRDLRTQQWMNNETRLSESEVDGIVDLLVEHRERRLDDERRKRRAASRTG